MHVYILKDDYTPDAGSSIFGVFSTYAKAEAEMKRLGEEDNEYGGLDSSNMDIDHQILDEEY